MKGEKLLGDHVISMCFSWTRLVDQNERRETAGDHVISMYFSWTCPSELK